MSTIKNFGLAGVSPDVQFGKTGPRVVAAGASFSFKTSAGSLVPVEIAAPTSDTHATTRLFVNTGMAATRTGAGLNADGTYTANATGFYTSTASSLFSSVNLLDTAIKTISNLGDTSRASAGLQANGSYIANATGNYISTAATLFGADNLLDAGLKGVSVKVENLLTTAGANTNGTYTANATGNYVNAATSLKTADNLLDAALFAVSSRLGTTITSTGLATDGTLPAWTSTNYVTGTTSVIAAIKNLDSAVKTNADTITNLGNVFNYVGTLNGGADTASAYDLSTLPAAGRDAGDYYKIAAAGYFKDTSAGTPYYVNLGDGLVKNKTASGWDKIDNTDSTVSGTTNRLTVTGAPDTGYVVDIAATYVGQASISTLGTITSGVWNGTAIAPTRGGTGLTTYAAGSIIYASAADTLAALPKGSSKQYLRVSTGGLPEYVSLVATDVAFSSGNYTATNVSAALDEVYGRVASAATSTITSPDTKTTVSATDTTGISFSDEIASTKTEFLRAIGTAASAQFAAQGTGANVDIVLTPKGTGSVGVSGARITSMANATATTDALAFGQAKAIFTRYVAVDVSETNTNVPIAAINGIIMRVMVNVTTAFASGTVLTIGYSGAQTALAAATDIDHAAVALNVIENVQTINQSVVAYVSGTGSGVAKVIIEYLGA